MYYCGTKNDNTMKPGLILGSLAALTAFLYIRSKKDMVNQLQVKLTSLNIDWSKTKQSLFLTTFVNLRINLFNPTNSKLTIKHIFVEIYVNGKLSGQVTKNDDFLIAANSNSDINFTARLNTLNLGTAIIELIKSQEAPELKAVGYIETSLGRIPFNKTSAAND